MSARPLSGILVSAWSLLAVRERATLGALAAVGPLLTWVAAAASGGPAFNDFNVYWLAGQLVDRGLSPHDAGALADLARERGRDFVLGGGYSYPLPFAVAMVPLGRLPFEAALGVFLGGSIALFSINVADWLRWLRTWVPGGDLAPRRMQLVALLAGCFPPVMGSVATGQANLLVLGVLAPGVAYLLSNRIAGRVGGGLLVGLASVVKLVPGAIVVPLILAGRIRAATSIVVAGVGTLLAAALLAPGSTRGGNSLLALLDPDPYFTNMSINGFVTRLVVPTEQLGALVPGAFDPGLVMATVTLLFAAGTAVALWQVRTSLDDRRQLALGIAFALLAAVIGGPKNSFWNATLTLVVVGLLLAAGLPDLDARRLARLGRLDRCLAIAFPAGIVIQVLVWAIQVSIGVPLTGVASLAGSAALYGMLALWLLIARRLIAVSGSPGEPVTLS